jgi:hypothetical protein
MTKYDGPTGAPVLVVNLGAISGGQAAHLTGPFCIRFFRSLSFLPESQGGGLVKAAMLATLNIARGRRSPL